MALGLSACAREQPTTDVALLQWLTLPGQCSQELRPALSQGRYLVKLDEGGRDLSLRVDSDKLVYTDFVERHGQIVATLDLRTAGNPTLTVQCLTGSSMSGKARVEIRRLQPDRTHATTPKWDGYTELASVFSAHGRALTADRQRVAASLASIHTTLLANGEKSAAIRVKHQEAAIRYRYLDDWEEAARAATFAENGYRQLQQEPLAAQARLLATQARMEYQLTGDSRESAAAALASSLDELTGYFTRNNLRNDLAFTINNRGLLADYQYHFDEAARYYGQASAIYAELGERGGQLVALQNAANVAFLGGQVTNAINSFEAAIPLADPRGAREHYADLLHNYASALAQGGNHPAALGIHHQALAIYRDLDRPAEIARSLHGLGSTYFFAHDYPRALAFFSEALPIRRARNDQRGTIATLRAMGSASMAQGDARSGIGYLLDALSLSANANQSRQIEVTLVDAYRKTGRPDLARKLLTRLLSAEQDDAPGLRSRLALLDLQPVAADPANTVQQLASIVAKLKAMGLIAEAARAEWMQSQALWHLGQKAAAYTALSSAIAAGTAIAEKTWVPELRASSNSGLRDFFDTMIAFLIAEKKYAQALAVADRRKSKLLELSRGALPVSLSGEPNSQTNLSDLYAGLEAVIWANGPNDARARELRFQIEALRSRQDARQTEETDRAKIRETNPPPEFSLRSLPADSIAMEYHLANPVSHVWVLSAGGTTYYQLASRDRIEAAAQRFIRVLRSPASPLAEVNAAASALSDLVLRPVVSKLTSDNLVVVPDGILHRVPFSALRLAGPAAESNFLIDRIAVSGLPALRFLSISNSSRPRLENSAVVFDIAYVSSQPKSDFAPSTTLPALPGSAQEGQAVLAAIASKQAIPLRGAAASRQNFLQLPFGRLDLLHFAGHAIDRSDAPELSSLFLAANNPISVQDIRQRRIHAKLVVLSACDSGSGKIFSGEAPLGLSLAFLGAGSQAVVASLWQASDAAARDLAKGFYANLAAEHGLAKSLQLAQLAIRKNKRFEHPYFWAGLQLTTASVN